MCVGDLVKKIKEKRELAGLADDIVYGLVEKYIEKTRLNIDNLKKSELKILVKDIRAQLRDYAGRFQVYTKEWKKRDELLEKNDILTILKTHTSTKERISFYPELRRLIAKLGIRSILDLGCGINPLALSSPEIKYYASDINKEELELVERFFRKNHIDGNTFICDLRKIESCTLPAEVDLCLIFKVLDIIEKKSHKLAEMIINKVNARYLLISFSTRTISGKPMAYSRRIWMEKMLSRLNYDFELIKAENEIFYLVKKSGDS